MKKILSILLALSVACGSIMLTSCSEDEKEDDNDKSVSDKADKDDEDEDDEDDEKSDDEDESSDEEDESSDEEDESSDEEDETSDEEDESSDEEDESSDEEDESSDEEDESSDEEDESSDEEDESSDEEDESSDEEDESSEDDDPDMLDEESEFVPSFEGYIVTAYGTDYEWPIPAEPFLEFFDLDTSETLEADGWDWFYAFDDEDYTIAELDIFNPSADEETAYADCYIDYLNFNADCTDLDVTVNGVGIGSTLDDINEAFALEFTINDGWVEVWDDEYWGNEVNFFLEDGVVTQMEILSDDEYFFSDDEVVDDGGDVDTDYTTYEAGETVEYSGISFVVPEGFQAIESGSDLGVYSTDSTVLEMINFQSAEAASIDDVKDVITKEMLDEEMTASFDGCTLLESEYEITTIEDTYDAISYAASIEYEDTNIIVAQLTILLDDCTTIITIAYDEANLSDEFSNMMDTMEIL